VGLNINSIGGTPSLDIKRALTKFPDLLDVDVRDELVIGAIIYPR
jgi:hypothetical protein